MQKYRCYYINDFGYEYSALVTEDVDGYWYRVEDVDARIGELEKALQRIVDLSDSEMRDGDEARAIASSALMETATK